MSDQVRIPTHRRTAVWLVALLVIVIICLALALAVAPLVEGTATAIKGLSNRSAAQATGRLLGVAAALTLLLFELAVIGYSGVILRRLGLRKGEWASLVGCGVAWMCAAWLLDFGKGIGGEYALTLVFDLAERETLGAGYWTVFDAINLVGATIPAVVGAALCGLIHRSRLLDPTALATRTRQFRVLMYLTIAVLIAGTFFVFSINRWSALVGDLARREAVLILSSGIMLNVGLFYSVLLVIAFVPTALVLMHAIEEQEARVSERDTFLDRRIWRRENHLDFSPLTELRTYGALASPLIASVSQAFLLGPMLRVFP